MTTNLRKTYSKNILDKFTDFDNDNRSYTQLLESNSSAIVDDSNDDYIQRDSLIKMLSSYNNAFNEYLIINKNIQKNLLDFRNWAYFSSNVYNLDDYIPGYSTYASAAGVPTTVEDIVGCWNVIWPYNAIIDRSTLSIFRKPGYQDDYILGEEDTTGEGEDKKPISPYATMSSKPDLVDVTTSNLFIGRFSFDNYSTTLNYAINHINNYTINGINVENIYKDVEKKETGNTTTYSRKSIDVSGNTFKYTEISDSSPSGYFDGEYTGNINTDFYFYFNIIEEVDIVFINNMSWEKEKLEKERNESFGFDKDDTIYRYTLTISYTTRSGLQSKLLNKLYKEDPLDITKKILYKDVNDYYREYVKIFYNSLFSELVAEIRNQGKGFLDDINSPTNPDLNYSNLIKKLNCAKNNDVFDNIIQIIYGYLQTRSGIVYNYISSCSAYNDALKARMNKKTGTFLKWYRSITNIDSSIQGISQKYMTNRSLFSSLAVWPVKEGSSENKIIIEKVINPYYYSVIGNFPTLNVGDKIYLLDDDNAETSTRVNKITETEIDGDVSLDDKDNAIVSKIKAYIITTENQINPIYSTESNFRLVKELS